MTKRAIIIAVASVILICTAGLIAYNLFLDEFGGLERSSDTSDTGTQIVGQDLDSPWSVVFYDDVALVSSRNTGEIRELLPDGGSRVVGTVADSVHRSEGGLLGLAVDSEARLYAYYTTASDNRIVRFSLQGEAGSLSLGEPEVILSGLPSAANHNGGRIAFGPDGMLYATVGDAGDAQAAQDRNKLHGKILRLTPDGEVPADNPFPDSLVYSYGHRNPQGIAWASDGTMFSSEFGQNTWDELNIITAGANYGWPEVEGKSDCDAGQDCLYADPVQQWTTSEASPSGMTYADGRLFIANLRGTMLRSVPVNDLGESTTHFENRFGRIRDVTIAPDGKLWFVTNNTDGRGRPGNNDDHILSISLQEV